MLLHNEQYNTRADEEEEKQRRCTVLVNRKQVSATHCCVALYVRNSGVSFLVLHQVGDLVLQTGLQSTGSSNAHQSHTCWDA